MTTYGPETTSDEVLEGVDLTGKVVVVTGASSGLGLDAARAMAAHGAEVVMAVRDPIGAAAAAETVGPNGHLVELDLASLGQVRTAAAAITERWPRIDVVVNNAGVMSTPPGRTAEGFDLQLGVNHLGHFLLTALLAPALGPSARIVNTTSLGHMVSGMRWDDPHFRVSDYEKWQAYGQSKTANILFTLGLAQRGYTAYAVHPGMIMTELYRHLSTEELAGMHSRSSGYEPGLKTVPQGSATLVWAATADGIPSGSYLADCQIGEAAAHATDPADAERLWRWSEEQVGQTFGS